MGDCDRSSSSICRAFARQLAANRLNVPHYIVNESRRAERPVVTARIHGEFAEQLNLVANNATSCYDRSTRPLMHAILSARNQHFVAMFRREVCSVVGVSRSRRSNGSRPHIQAFFEPLADETEAVVGYMQQLIRANELV